jgi:drug/metabolite transporter (DMT)-like permease
MIDSSIWFALGAVIIFASSSVVYTHFSTKISVLWMNSFKATIALVAFAIAACFSKDWTHQPETRSLLAFLFSGLIGLNIADLFLLRAFKSIGAARTLLIFSFQPIFIGFASYFLFHQTISISKIFAIFFMIACVLTLSYEKFRASGRWEIWGPLCALAGVILDGIGILLTRFGFDSDAQVTVFEGNFYRCLGAGLGFFVISQFIPLGLVKSLQSLPKKPKTIVLLASFTGTFLSLTLYLTALSHGHLATITAIAGTGPIFAGIVESIWARKWPTIYLYAAFALFGCGFYLLV